MQHLLALTDAKLMFLAGCGMLTFLLLKRSYRYFGRRSRSWSASPIESISRPQSPWDGAHRDASARIEQQKVEMHEMARDLNGQLTSRIVILERLIRESQQQIDRLEHLLKESKSAGAI